ncbi:Zinc finger protein [Tolypocladium capitatum]|uniref:Zinc finger protein n=1 Tax=Tolypocladium capitatum TaxID=45235 RepID=A0A2K3QDF8_9HYPO|nr:Zinc finger protein [Tolypocladium capitatum]
MADVRSLLRQQRAARRIEHPSAAYTEAGKLLCTLCREQIKAETLWESHVQSENHRRRLHSADKANGRARSDAAGTRQKRKLDVEGEDEDVEDAARRKRNRGAATEVGGPDGSGKEAGKEGTAEHTSSKEAALTPPALVRRMSTTPSQGVELQIASRPATPAHRDTFPSQAAGPTTSLPSRQASNLATAGPPTSMAAQVDEAEWEAFQADIAALGAPYDGDAVISAPAMTAEESAAAAAATEAQAQGSRKPQVDVDIEYEREEATRAMEDEFEEMQELEGRVKRLKEKREALRKRGESHGQESLEKPPQGLGKENVKEAAVADGDADDDDEEDEDEDDWDGFRFRTS